MHVVRLGDLTVKCADCPDGLVGYDDVSHVLLGEIGKGGRQLVVYDTLGFAGSSLLLGFADTENWHNPVTDSGLNFISDFLQAFVKIQPPTRMSNYTVMYEIAQHGEAHFTGIWTSVFVKRILSGQPKLAAINLKAERLQAQVARREHDFYVSVQLDALVKAVHQQASLLGIEVHFPITNDKKRLHYTRFIILMLKCSKPLLSLPSSG